MATLEKLKLWLADPENVVRLCIRKRYVTTNGIEISIQQSEFHNCNNDNQVEMWCCQHDEILEPYGNGENPYGYVPLEVAATYIDKLESLSQE